MDILKKILGFLKPDQPQKVGSDLHNKKIESSDKKSASLENIENLLLPIIKNATKIEVQKAVRPPQDSQLLSHFGGQPYFEEGDGWYKSKNGRHMDFIFQIFNTDELVLPQSIKLIQFFYDANESPWETTDDGWYVKIYETLNPSKVKKIARPIELEVPKYCEMVFKLTKSLPDWQGIDVYESSVANLSSSLNNKEPWDSYDKAVKKLIGGDDYQSQLGGYPKWIQGESTPQKSNGENMQLLFQLDSEENARLVWEDAGMVYLFYDEEEKRIEFVLQCH